jgi:hypothetical protein
MGSIIISSITMFEFDSLLAFGRLGNLNYYRTGVE